MLARFKHLQIFVLIALLGSNLIFHHIFGCAVFAEEALLSKIGKSTSIQSPTNVGPEIPSLQPGERLRVGFAIKLADGKFIQYKTSEISDGDSSFSLEDKWIRAKVLDLGNYHWELQLTVKTGTVVNVWFPWLDQELTLNDNIEDDLVLYPYLMGIVRRAESLRRYAWWGLDYPGPCISPLVVITDTRSALMAAATNWPPRRVKPLFCREGVALLYTESMEADQMATFEALILKVQVPSPHAVTPWQLALDHYKEWLEIKMWESRLFPAAIPDWMWDSHGFLNIQLENVTTFDPEHLRRIWQESKGFFPWIQFWGQMSNYAGPPMYAVPRLEPGEATGCCLPIPRIHQRYLPELIDLASEMAKDGHIGYYSRPKDTQELGDHGKRFLLDWLQENMLNGANVFYIDVLGGRFFGDPLGIAAFLRDQCPPDTFIEYPVDIYPTPFLISGSLSGGNWAGGPKTKDQFILGRTAGTTFPEFGRYLLDDRIIFLGQSNGDHLFWGPTNDYWTERQVFLLGAKYDIITLFENHEEPKQMNRAVECAILERDRVDWWMRRPVYLHQNGVTDIPTGIDIRNFLGNSGENLIVIDNWIQRTNAKFRHNGSWIMIPSKPLSILVR